VHKSLKLKEYLVKAKLQGTFNGFISVAFGYIYTYGGGGAPEEYDPQTLFRGVPNNKSPYKSRSTYT